MNIHLCYKKRNVLKNKNKKKKQPKNQRNVCYSERFKHLNELREEILHQHNRLNNKADQLIFEYGTNE